MIPFSLTFIIPHLNSGRNLDAAEIHGENTVAFVISSLKCYLRIKMWFRVRISEINIYIEEKSRNFKSYYGSCINYRSVSTLLRNYRPVPKKL